MPSSMPGLVPAACIFPASISVDAVDVSEAGCPVLLLPSGPDSQPAAVVQLPGRGYVHYLFPLHEEHSHDCGSRHRRRANLLFSGRVQSSRVFPGRGRHMLSSSSLMATLMLPFQVTMIPLFIVFKNLGWVNSWLPLIVPHWFGGALYIFLSAAVLHDHSDGVVGSSPHRRRQ